ncbi:MAG TPA: polyprenol monophosphomannose synthase [Candidatus Nanoarchaeia archaeon]|nr:polyprenol monophosphomannose synthase [Candidatus Nanoarchaeia archaeon]
MVQINKISVCVVIPTYNEAANISNLLDLVYSEENAGLFKDNHIILDVLVVDDNSPDMTSFAVKEYQKKNNHINLLSRKKKMGLGAAYIAGMEHAMYFYNPDIIFEMDADLSHNPSKIFPMIKKITGGADFVIGSRYIDGGTLPAGWGFKRKLISKSANYYARTILGMKKVHDCTGGFRAIRASLLKNIDLDSLNVKGYAFQISLLEAAIRNGAVIEEIPIDFQDRNTGKSKMGFIDIAEVGMVVLRLAMQRLIGPYSGTPILEPGRNYGQGKNTART